MGEARAAAAAAPGRSWLREGALQLLVVAAGVGHRVAGGDDSIGSAAAVAAVTLLAGGVVLARHLWPTAALVGAGLLSAGSVLLQLAAVPVVGFAVGRRLPPARLWTATAASVAVSGLLTAAVNAGGRGGEPTAQALLGWAVFVLVLLVVPVGCGAVLGQRRPAGRLLRERNAHLERTRATTAARARAHERARITDEMHDMLGHRLSLLSVHAGALELRLARDVPAAGEQARLIGGTARTALAELHQILQLTRGAAGDSTGTSADPAVGTRDDVAALVERSREAGLAVELRWRTADTAPADTADADTADAAPADAADSTVDLDARVRQAVHRMVREGLTNVHKHAPTTPGVVVDVAVDGRRVRAAVRNAPPAVGPRPGAGTRRGLAGLEERAALLGGTCTGHPTPDGGFVLALDVPRAPDGPAADPAGLRVPDEPDPSWELADEPPPLQRAAVMSTRRTVALVALAALLVVPVAFLALMGVLTVVGAVTP